MSGRAADGPAAEKRVSTHNDGPTSWLEAGHGFPTVFLHGLGGTRSAWGPQLSELSEDRRCLAWDMPGYGSSQPETPLTYASIAERLMRWLDQLDIERADLVGLSFGGMHALHTALGYPQRVRRMVLANTSPAFGIDGTDPQQWKSARLAPLEQGATPASMASSVLDAIAGRPLDPDIRAQLVSAFGRISTDGFRAAVECLPHNDVRFRLGELQHPCLVIGGELDQETPVAYARALAEGLPNSELVVLDGVGHLSPSEDPERFNDHVRRHLIRPQNTSGN